MDKLKEKNLALRNALLAEQLAGKRSRLIVDTRLSRAFGWFLFMAFFLNHQYASSVALLCALFCVRLATICEVLGWIAARVLGQERARRIVERYLKWIEFE